MNRITTPQFQSHVENKADYVKALIAQVGEEESQRLLIKDLAIHAAITYYAAVTSNGQSHPPRGETIVKTAATFESYYDDITTNYGENK